MLDNIKEKIGVDITKITTLDSLTRILHLLPSLIEDGHIISFGGAGIGKTTLITSSSPKCTNITKLSSASLFGDKKSATPGLISSENDVVYLEQASKISTIDSETMANLLTHCNGDDVKRIESDTSNRTSVVLLGNCLESYIPTLKKPYPKFNSNFFEKLPDEFKETQGLERFIILPSFLMEKVTSKNILEDNKKKEEIERIEHVHYELDKELSIRDYKAQCKIITALNYFLNSNKELKENDWRFKGFKAIAESICNLKKGVYTPFYYKNEDGRRLALALILHYLPKDSVIEEAHFLEHRALIKIKGEDIWYKIALDISGKFENQIEFSHYQESKEGHIAEIYESNNDNIILKQKYIPLESNFFSIKDFDFIQDNNKYERLWEKNKELKRVMKSQQDEIEQLKIAFDKIYLAITTGDKSSLSLISLFSPMNKEKLDKESLKKELSLKLNIKLDELKNRFIGFENNKIYLINFASILYSKTTKY